MTNGGGNGSLLVLAGIGGLLWYMHKGQSSLTSTLASITGAVPATTSTVPVNQTTPIGGGGVPSSGTFAPIQTPSTYNPFYDPFDSPFFTTPDQGPTYREQYPYAPGIVVVPPGDNEE